MILNDKKHIKRSRVEALLHLDVSCPKCRLEMTELIINKADGKQNHIRIPQEVHTIHYQDHETATM